MRRERFESALQLLKPEQWRVWEETCSVYLTDEFPTLRPVASPDGDQGRDGELWSVEGDAAVMLQYSVTPKWRAKIRETATKLSKNFKDVNVLIHCSNHSIGADADDLKAELRRAHRLALDTRDRSWFLDRMDRSAATQAAAKRLAEIVVDPIVSTDEVVRTKGQAFSDYETRVAFVFLNLQMEDDAQDKGLTRVCFESLVRAVLRRTDLEHRMPRAEIHRQIGHLFPASLQQEVVRYVDAALRKMDKKRVRHWSREDEFCLSVEERSLLAGRLGELEAADDALRAELEAAAHGSAVALGIALPSDLSAVVTRMRRLIDAVLLERGELFVTRFAEGRTHVLSADDLHRLTLADVAAHPERAPLAGGVVPLVEKALHGVLTDTTSRAHAYLRGLANAYTVMAFLKQTPDVQEAIVKMFSDGELWLDTNIILRVLAETLLEEEHLKQYSALLRGAVEAGLSLRITPGVLEEVERHFNKSLSCARAAGIEWRGGIPFLFSAFIWSGRSRSEFPAWVEVFRGAARPEEDIAQYLSDEFSVAVSDSLREPYERAPANTRAAVQEYWRGIHDRRRTADDPMTEARLADHDAENFLGVLERRHAEPTSPMGFKTWWLTLDTAAFAAADEISKTMRPSLRSPTMSPDFLTNYLAVGPLRRMLTKRAESALPLMMDMTALDAVPPELLAIAEQHRDALRALPDRIRRRRIRDMLDYSKERAGALARGGVAEMERQFQRLFSPGGKDPLPNPQL